MWGRRLRRWHDLQAQQREHRANAGAGLLPPAGEVLSAAESARAAKGRREKKENGERESSWHVGLLPGVVKISKITLQNS